MKDLVFKKCLKCNNLVQVIKNGCDSLSCCGEVMKEVKANSVDAAFEKHVPKYEVIDDKIVVTVNHVMDEDHYIEWIMVQTNDSTLKKEFKPGDIPIITVPYEKGVILYSYCNKHGLWKSEVE